MQHKRTLRPSQEKAINDLRLAVKDGHKRVMLQAPTGYGKTVVAAAIAESCLRKGTRMIFCVPLLSLIDQTVLRFEEQGITEVGVIQGNHPKTDYSQPIQVASIQTLQKRNIPEADLIVIDEAHVNYKFVEKWINSDKWKDVPVIGLSASPWSRGLGLRYGKLIIAATLKQLIEEKSLSDFKVYAPSTPDLDGVRTVRGDFHEGDLSSAMDKPQITADIVSTWLKLGQNRPTILFAVDRNHARSLQEQFEKVKVNCGYIDGETPPEEREEVRKKFHSGEIKVVSSVNCLTTGLDWDVRCLILGRPTKSEILHVQQIGRALRTAPGKDYALILDHAGNHHRLGFVTDIHYEELCENKVKPKKKAEKESDPKKTITCPSCKEVKKSWSPVCSSCGYRYSVVSKVVTAEGELVYFDVNGKQSMVVTPLSQRTRQEWYSGLIKFAKEKDYKPSWASLAYKEKFGEWPNGLKKFPSLTINQEVLRFCDMKVERFRRQQWLIKRAKEKNTA